MSLGQDALPLLEEYKAASDQEATATKELHDYLQAGGKNESILNKLASSTEQTHAKKMALYEKLQKFRVDHD